MKNVLIVEDEEPLRVLTASSVEEIGYKSLTADGPEQALAVLADHPVDVLLVDLTLAGDHEAGLKLAVTAAEQKSGLRVLYTTGRGITDGMRAIFVENSGFLAKPFTLDDLRTALRNLLPPS